jgi:hypothetical protein
MKTLIPLFLVGSAVALILNDYLVAGIFLLSFSSFLAGLFTPRPPQIEFRDPNKPFTSRELMEVGIRPPENYDDWIDGRGEDAAPSNVRTLSSPGGIGGA